MRLRSRGRAALVAQPVLLMLWEVEVLEDRRFPSLQIGERGPDSFRRHEGALKRTALAWYLPMRVLCSLMRVLWRLSAHRGALRMEGHFLGRGVEGGRQGFSPGRSRASSRRPG